MSISTAVLYQSPNIVVMDHYITPPAPESSSDDKNISDMDKIEAVRRNSDEALGQVMGLDLEKEKTAQGDAYFHRLGWKRLTVILIVTAIALGSLSLPGAYATLGMIPGVIVTIVFGFVAIYASYIIGLVKLKYPEAKSYVDVGTLLMGKWGDVLFSVIFVSLLTLVVGSHCLTGTIAFVTMTESDVCSLVFGVMSAIILLILAIPPSFSEVAILGYIDFASILIAIGITVIATGVQSSEPENPWSAWPKENISLAEAFVAISNIVFAYAFASKFLKPWPFTILTWNAQLDKYPTWMRCIRQRTSQSPSRPLAWSRPPFTRLPGPLSTSLLDRTSSHPRCSRLVP